MGWGGGGGGGRVGGRLLKYTNVIFLIVGMVVVDKFFSQKYRRSRISRHYCKFSKKKTDTNTFKNVDFFR